MVEATELLSPLPPIIFSPIPGEVRQTESLIMQVSSKTVGGRGGEGWLGRVGVEWGGGVGYYFTDCCQVFFNRVGDFCAVIFYNLFLFSLKDNTQTHTRYSVQPVTECIVYMFRAMTL